MQNDLPRGRRPNGGAGIVSDIATDRAMTAPSPTRAKAKSATWNLFAAISQSAITSVMAVTCCCSKSLPSDRTRLTFHAKDFLPPALGWFSYPPHLLRRMQKAINIVQVRVETESEDDEVA
jgi:hypothetical protein